ncbi:LysR family transcriptional regulator [Cytobacillus depressus]|uniref:LysR family transcriptional regulator n=1 Tax=Cytobacillus depressus TaxID=1602942 RepID=A0A6L3V4Z8_9BACI|nr:LysR family transcriptional regulator [Cytobacillus depressus]KAB2336191.1 LysR family transcriptional regulator [Cytobacillus depressus]
MNLRDFEVFKTIAECGSFSKASEKLFIAQPSLSKTIQKLEKKLGVTLFDRSNRIFRLTDEGQLVYKRAITVLQHMKELKIELEDTNEHIQGHLKVGVPQILGTFFFPKVAKAFTSKYKGVTLEIFEEGGLKVEKLVEKGEVDVAFVVIPTQSKELEEQFIFEAPFVACLPKSHALKNEQQIALAQLQQDDWILFDASFALSQVVLESCRKEKFVPNIAYRTTQWDFLLALVRDELGVTIIPSPLTETYSQNLCVKQISSQNISWKIGIVVKKNRYKTRALKAFLQIVSDVYK